MLGRSRYALVVTVLHLRIRRPPRTPAAVGLRHYEWLSEPSALQGVHGPCAAEHLADDHHAVHEDAKPGNMSRQFPGLSAPLKAPSALARLGRRKLLSAPVAMS
jgi:hypothetical protein